MANPFAAEHFDVINSITARVNAIFATFATLPLDTVKNHAQVRPILGGSMAANAVERNDTFFMPLSVDQSAVGNPQCNSTIITLATTDPLAIMVAESITDGEAKLTIVGTEPAEAINDAVNFIGPLGSSIFVTLNPDVSQLLEANVAVKRIGVEQLRMIRGNQNMLPIDGGPGGPNAIAAAVANATVTAAARKLHIDIGNVSESFENIEYLNRLFSPGHPGPDRGPPASILMSHARKNILAAFNDLSKNKIGARPYVFTDPQLDAMIFEKYGADPGQISIAEIHRSSEDTTILTVTAVDRLIRDVANARRITHGPRAAASILSMAIAVREAMDVEECQGNEYTMVINYCLSAVHHLPSILPEGVSKRQALKEFGKVTAATPFISEFKAHVLRQIVMKTAAAQAKMDERGVHSSKPTTTAPFHHGSASLSPVRVRNKGKASSVSASTSPVRPSQTVVPVIKPFKMATAKEVEDWQNARPAFLPPGAKVMCKTVAAGKACTRSYCQGKHDYKHPDPASHQEVIAWVLKSPYGTIQK